MYDPLGFLAASIGIVGWHNGLWPVWFPVMVFSPFILDATVTLFKRVLEILACTPGHYQRRCNWVRTPQYCIDCIHFDVFVGVAHCILCTTPMH
jgi:hypothetical protein